MAQGQNPFIKAYKVLRWFVLAVSLVVLFLALKSPANSGPKIDRAAQHEQAQAFQEKISALAAAHQQGSEVEVSLESGEVNAAIAESLSDSRSSQAQMKETAATLTTAAEPKPANAPSEQSGDGQIKDARVEFSNDIVTGYFTTQQYGREIHLTVAGHLGCKDGFATFEPTAFKIGDLSVP